MILNTRGGNGAADLGEADSKDGVRAAAGVVHACAARAAMGVAQRHQVLHVLVVGNQAFGQTCTHTGAHVPFPYVDARHAELTLNVRAVQRVLPHSQSSVPVCGLLFKQIVHAFIVDLRIAGDTETNKQKRLPLVQRVTVERRGYGHRVKFRPTFCRVLANKTQRRALEVEFNAAVEDQTIPTG